MDASRDFWTAVLISLRSARGPAAASAEPCASLDARHLTATPIATVRLPRGPCVMARPIKPKSLAGKVRSWFPHLAEDERLRLIQRLYKETRVRESNNTLTYEL
jgi:hypothetical protein